MQKHSEKQLQIQKARVHWNPTMDIIAVWSHTSPLLSVFRCSDNGDKFHIQKLFDRENIDGCTIRSFAFQEKGVCFCAIGMSDGRLELLAVENAQEVCQWQTNKDQIRIVLWQTYEHPAGADVGGESQAGEEIGANFAERLQNQQEQASVLNLKQIIGKEDEDQNQQQLFYR